MRYNKSKGYDSYGKNNNIKFKSKSSSKAELVFADPDNGIIGSKSLTDKKADKYIFPSEIKKYYENGQNVVYYCQKARRTNEQWENTKSEMQQYLPDARVCVITYHRGTQRSYIFVIHPEDYRRYMDIIYSFLNYYKFQPLFCCYLQLLNF